MLTDDDLVNTIARYVVGMRVHFADSEIAVSVFIRGLIVLLQFRALFVNRLQP